MKDKTMLKPATQGDSLLFMLVRNDPDVIAASRIQKSVTPEEHSRWFESQLKNPNARLFTIRDSESKIIALVNVFNPLVGTARLDLSDSFAEISIALLPWARNRGIGKKAVAELKKIAEDMGKKPFACIRPENIASLKCFQACGVEIECV